MKGGYSFERLTSFQDESEIMPFPNEEREFQLPDAFATIAVKSEAQSDTDTNTDDVSTPRERQRNESKNEYIYRSNCFDRKNYKNLTSGSMYSLFMMYRSTISALRYF